MTAETSVHQLPPGLSDPPRAPAPPNDPVRRFDEPRRSLVPMLRDVHVHSVSQAGEVGQGP